MLHGMIVTHRPPTDQRTPVLFFVIHSTVFYAGVLMVVVAVVVVVSPSPPTRSPLPSTSPRWW